MSPERTVTIHVGYDEHVGDYEATGECYEVAEVAKAGLTDADDIAEVRFAARTATDLRRATVFEHWLPMASRFRLELAHVPTHKGPPLPSVNDEDLWSRGMALRPQDGINQTVRVWECLQQIAAKRSASGSWEIDLEFCHRVPLGAILTAVCRALDGHRSMRSGPVAGPTGPGTVFPRLALIKDPARHRFVTRAELVEGTVIAVAAGPEIARTPPVDERSVNPTGFLRRVGPSFGSLISVENRHSVVVPGLPPIRLPLSGEVTDREISELRSVRGILIPFPSHVQDQRIVARIVAGFGAAGVPIYGEPHTEWPGLLGDELATLFTTATKELLCDDLYREEHSILLRRHVLRHHGTIGRLYPGERPRVSVLMSTKRPEMVARAVAQVRRQRDVEVELVLALHGFPPSFVPPDVAAECQVICVPSSAALGEVLNLAAARAGGTFLAKMDDDDFYGPDHLADLSLSQRFSGADLVGFSGEQVYLAELDLTIGRMANMEVEKPTSAVGNGILMGGSLFITRSAFDALGGFKPVPLHEDGELCAAVRSAGGLVYRQHGLNHIYYRGAPENHSWQVSNEWYLNGSPYRWPGLHFNRLMTQLREEGARLADN
ncbi:glycosyltransferase family 2 protein [Nonomuraea sp. B19D2]|uniref:glycosyltransferase n=1 Tax=Nonomuraea sp. B19D2 TaxID=3159561 RepID=UPI0032DB8631